MQKSTSIFRSIVVQFIHRKEEAVRDVWADRPSSVRKEHRMFDILYLGGSTVLYAMLFLPVITILSVAVLYFAYETIQKFRRRRGMF